MIYCGVDVGASATKVAIINEKKQLISNCVRKSGVDFKTSAMQCMEEALGRAGKKNEQDRKIVATGYGRGNVDFADEKKTEIACHAKAAFYFFPREITIVDIGGQDSKVIKLDSEGRRVDFKMNRKCAAGTGAFLEEIAIQLDIPLDRMNEYAESIQEKVTIGSFCTVFTKTEILALIRHGRKLEEIVRGVYDSVVKRIIEMDSLEGEVVMTGGVVEHNPVIVSLLEAKIGKKVSIPPNPQIAGAFGAALFAQEI